MPISERHGVPFIPDPAIEKFFQNSSTRIAAFGFMAPYKLTAGERRREEAYGNLVFALRL